VTFTTDSTIAAPAAEAFAAMADARNEPAWNGQVSRSELLSGEPIGQGSRFLTVNRGQEYEAVITTHRQPELLVFEVTGKQMDITATFRFSHDGAGSRLHGDFDFRPKGALRFAFPAMGPMIRRDLRKQSASFAAFASDRGAHPAAQA
jgi:uncharacterized protein YndB with AHSA1/START domain